MFSNLENRYFFHNAISFFSKKTLKNLLMVIQGKEDRYLINQRVKEREKFLYDPSILVDHHYTADGNLGKVLDKFILFNEIEFLNSLDELLKYDKIYITDTIDKIEKKTNQLKH